MDDSIKFMNFSAVYFSAVYFSAVYFIAVYFNAVYFSAVYFKNRNWNIFFLCRYYMASSN